MFSDAVVLWEMGTKFPPGFLYILLYIFYVLLLQAFLCLLYLFLMWSVWCPLNKAFCQMAKKFHSGLIRQSKFLQLDHGVFHMLFWLILVEPRSEFSST